MLAGMEAVALTSRRLRGTLTGMTSTLPDPGGTPRITDLTAARTLFAPIAVQPVEVAAFAYLDPEWRLLGMRHARSALATAIDVPMRAVATDVLAFNCTRVVMAHNHPNGDASPSAMDRALTKRLARALDALGVQLFDHLVLAPDRVTSFRALGLL